MARYGSDITAEKRLRKQGVPIVGPRVRRLAVLAQGGSRCQMCGRALLPRGGDWDIDHIVPVRDGGEHSIANVQTLCRRPCHLSKTNAERRARKARASKEQS